MSCYPAYSNACIFAGRKQAKWNTVVHAYRAAPENQDCNTKEPGIQGLCFLALKISDLAEVLSDFFDV